MLHIYKQVSMQIGGCYCFNVIIKSGKQVQKMEEFRFFQEMGPMPNRQNREREDNVTKSLPFARILESKKSLEKYPPILIRVFEMIFNDKQLVLDFAIIFPFVKRPTPMPSCNKNLEKSLNSYRCFDCLIHEGLLICEKCFKSGNHEGHRYIVVKQQGVCDCGQVKIMKPHGFCRQHNGKLELPSANQAPFFIFQLIMRQTFIWIFKLHNLKQLNESLSLLGGVLGYLLTINNQSLHYMNYTTILLFNDENNPLADNLIAIAVRYPNDRSSKLILDLFMNLLVLDAFIQKMVTSYLKAYCRLPNFENSKFQILFSQLMAHSESVVRSIRINPIEFIPQVSCNVINYFDKLHYLTVILPPKELITFLQPTLIKQPLALPFLDKIWKDCERQHMPVPIINVFPEHLKEEYLYYKIMMKLIGLMTDQEILKVILRNYYGMIKKYPFVKNKIVLVPQRIFILLIYRYCDFQIEKLKASKLAEILGVTEDVLFEDLNCLGQNFVGALGEYAVNLVRTTYFDNYLPIYVGEQGQIILIDYLAIKIIAMLGQDKDCFEEVLIKMYRRQLNSFPSIQSTEEAFEFFRKWNNMIKILVECIYSPRIETVLTALLQPQSLTDHHASSLLTHLFHNIGQANLKHFQCIKSFFFGSCLSQKVIEDVLIYDSSRKKYILKQGLTTEYELNLQLYVSLVKTNFQRLVENKKAESSLIGADQYTSQLQNRILSDELLAILLKQQLKVIDQQQIVTEEYYTLVKELAILNRQLKKYTSYNKACHDVSNAIWEEANMISERQITYHSTKNIINLEEISNLIGEGELLTNQKSNKVLERRKMIQKAKMEEKRRALRTAQAQVLKSYQSEPQEKVDEDLCLVCRGRENPDELCYFTKMKYSNLLFGALKIESKENIIFSSCFHTVHFGCFLNLTLHSELTHCSLCKAASNTLLPVIANPSSILCSKVTNQMELIMSLMSKTEADDVMCEGLLYIAHILLFSLSKDLSSKLVRTCKLVYKLIKHSYCNLEALLLHSNFLQQFFEKCRTGLNTPFDLQFFMRFLYSCFLEFKLKGAISEQQLAERTIELYLFMAPDSVRQIIFSIDRILSEEGQSQLSFLLKQLPPVPLLENKLPFKFYLPPKTVPQLLYLRDRYRNICEKTNPSHHPSICIICGFKCCFTCSQAKTHCDNKHGKQGLFFNLHTGGFYYLAPRMQLTIRSFYVTKKEAIWRPDREPFEFNFDEDLYEEMISSIKSGNLFYFLTHTFNGLKDGNINDRI